MHIIPAVIFLVLGILFTRFARMLKAGGELSSYVDKMSFINSKIAKIMFIYLASISYFMAAANIGHFLYG